MTKQMCVSVATPSAALKKTYRNYEYMTQEERDRKREMIKRERAFRKKCILLTIAICAAFCIAITQFSFRANAETVSNKQLAVSYKSVMIEKNDTLWDIAVRQTADFPEISIKDYIKKVKKVNRMEGDDIQSGNYLLLPTYCYLDK